MGVVLLELGSYKVQLLHSACQRLQAVVNIALPSAAFSVSWYCFRCVVEVIKTDELGAMS